MGTESGLPERLPESIERLFPNLTDYVVTSPRDSCYNCIAFAAGDTERRWDPGRLPDPGYYWPPEALRNDNDDIDALKRAFAAIGFEECDNGALEAGYRKIALYALNNEWQHAAIQDQHGEWSSKLGASFDIRHKTFQSLEDSIYGSVVCFMRRRIELESDSTEKRNLSRSPLSETN
jgi:hypothetical protein